MRILDQALEQIPAGPVMLADPRVALPPKSETYNSIEAMIAPLQASSWTASTCRPARFTRSPRPATASSASTSSSDGTGRPWKCRVRPPCFPATAVLVKVLPGLFIADVVPTFGMINMIGGECDR